MKYPVKLILAVIVSVMFPLAFVAVQLVYFIWYLKFSKNISSPLKAEDWEIEKDNYVIVADENDRFKLKNDSIIYITPFHWALDIKKPKQ